jgi:ribose 5-phosphate isomerase B
VIAIGCDPNAADLKRAVVEQLEAMSIPFEDFGSDDPIYANTAIAVAEAVARGSHDRGIVMCGTGIGVSIAANKVHGAYCALIENAYSAERAAKSNNANMIAMGAQTVGPRLARLLVRVYMESVYVPGGRSEPKIQRIYEFERSTAAKAEKEKPRQVL